MAGNDNGPGDLVLPVRAIGLMPPGPGGEPPTHRYSEMYHNGTNGARLLGPDGAPLAPMVAPAPMRRRIGAPAGDDSQAPPQDDARRAPGDAMRRPAAADASPDARLHLAQVAYYLMTLGVAAYGGGEAIARHVGWHITGGLAAMGVLELGAVVLLTHREARRGIGERAFGASLLALVIAATAVTVNVAGHLVDPDTGQVPSGSSADSSQIFQSAFFGAVSLIGALTFLLMSSARARDRRRARGLAVPVVPLFPVGQWLLHPLVTAAARARCKADPTLTAGEAMRIEVDERNSRDRHREISAELERVISERADPALARIAVLTYDAQRVAAGLRRSADHAMLTRLIAERLTAERLGVAHPGDAAPESPRPTRRRVASEAADSQIEATRPAPEALPESPRDADAPAPELAPELVDFDDAQIEAAIGDYVRSCRAAGQEPGQREMVRRVNAAGGRAGQRRCLRISRTMPISD